MRDLQTIARALGGDVVSGGVSFPPPGHSPKDRSGRLFLGPQYPDGFWIMSLASDDPLPIRGYVLDVVPWLSDRAGQHPREAHGCSPRGKLASCEDDRAARAVALWDEGHDPKGTPVEPYLERRGLRLCGIASGALRYHPSCPFAGKSTPAMLALVRDIRSNEPRAIHRTALTRDGHKAEIDGKDRLALGPLAGGAVKLMADEDVTTCLGIGEGIESTLSLRQLPEFEASPVWAVLSAGALKRFPVLPGIEALWIAVDHDPAGTEAAHQCAERWRTSGAEVLLVTPSAPRADLNDLIR